MIHCLVSRLQVISAVNADTDTDASHHNPDKLSNVTQSSLQFKNYENVSGKYDVMMYSYSNNRLASIMQGSVHRNNLGLVVVLK